MKLAVVVPAWNHVFFTQKTVESLFDAAALPDDEWKCILVDDGSTDDTWTFGAECQEKYGIERFTMIQHPENKGVSASWNSGLRCAGAVGAEFVAIVNNDMLFAPGWDKPLIDALEADPKLGIVSPMSTEQRIPADWPEGKDRHPNPAGYVGYMPLLGCCFMARLSHYWNVVGLFPESMATFWSDNWLVIATQAKGYECGYVRESYVHHLFCQTTSKIKDPSIWRNDEAAFREITKDMPALRPYCERGEWK